MKTKLLLLYFTQANEREYKERAEQLSSLQARYGSWTDFLPEQPVGSVIPAEVDAVLFPQLIGAIFSHKEDVQKIQLPIIILTSSFGTVEMWHWEIVAYLRQQMRLNVFAPYTVELAEVILRSIAAKKEMSNGINFLMFQDSPGEGMQSNIFKRFYWWEEESARQIENSFGVKIIYRSWKALNQRAREISDDDALALWNQRAVPTENLPLASACKAVKLYIAVKEAIDEVGNVYGVGANCLNESFHSDTTPCLAWSWIYECDHIIWACEGDIVTLISKFILYSALRRPMMMTNIYPFLVGMAALKHEKINQFPDISDPDNHALGVHCGYFGLAPQSFCTDWVMRPKVLEIVGEDAIVIDCRMKIGPITMAKLNSDMHTLTIIEAEIEDYAQYPGSDCRNGALIRYRNGNGHQIMENLSSHHAILIDGAATPHLLQLARVYRFSARVL